MATPRRSAYDAASYEFWRADRMYVESAVTRLLKNKFERAIARTQGPWWTQLRNVLVTPTRLWVAAAIFTLTIGLVVSNPLTANRALDIPSRFESSLQYRHKIRINYQYLFSIDFIHDYQANSTTGLEILRNEFFNKRTLGVQNPERDRATEALTHKLALLKALAPLNDKELKGFFRQLLTDQNQHWLVQWRALKNLNDFPNGFSSKAERQETLKALPEKVTVLSALSESELMGGVWRGDSESL